MVEPETMSDLAAYGVKELHLTSDTINVDERVHARVLAMAKANNIECVDFPPRAQSRT
jgi:hypothetical protein